MKILVTGGAGFIGSHLVHALVERGEDVHIPKRDLSEPVFNHGEGGIREVVRPGNTEHIKGDRIGKPQGGQGGGGGSQASDSGEGEDDFVFHLSKEEFMQVFFEDLALPNLARTTLAETPEYKTVRAGYVTAGPPTNLQVVRPMRGALGRRIALGMDKRRELSELETRLQTLRQEEDVRRPEIQAIATRPMPSGNARSSSSRSRSAHCAPSSNASPSSTRSTCASATASRCRSRPRAR